MSLYLGDNLISGALPNAANQSLSNLNSAGQTILNGKANTDLSNITDIANTIYLKNGYNCYLMAGDSGLPSVIFRNDGNDFYMLLTDNNDPKGSWNSLRPFVFNCSTGKVSAACANKVVIETYVNGASWYRVWSDGWVEQGGQTATRTNNSRQTINFLKTFSNTNYTVVVGAVKSSQSTNENDCMQITDKAIGSFQCYMWSTRATSWYACGQGIQESELIVPNGGSND